MRYYAPLTSQNDFFCGHDPYELIKKFGSPLYVYNENILRQKCLDMKELLKHPNVSVHYSVKANSNIKLLKIIKSEGLNVDAVSLGEIYLEKKAGFKNSQILFVGNNMTRSEMSSVINDNIMISVDSLSQLKQFGEINNGGEVLVRINPGYGSGHHQKVITAGNYTKFGINYTDSRKIREIAQNFNLKIIGLNMHIGSLFQDMDIYKGSVKIMLSVLNEFPEANILDIGGGFGVSYNKINGDKDPDLRKVFRQVERIIGEWSATHKRELEIIIEPGRYISAECGVLLGTVSSVKTNYMQKYAGTDMGFNVLIRSAMYDVYHDIEVYSNSESNKDLKIKMERCNIVGNICESGDYIAKDRLLPLINEGDLIGVMSTGAYGFSMSSNYNSRLRPAEILIDRKKNIILIRKRETFEQLLMNNY
ncbi:MAG: diaminopimelate decarboxylase [Candidatus Delongbacteria bacterium]|jgi:diaminopimelate decarboxylase|nr:diaminopimelate decarboxylase [Candidatus Delongbacteria bacterium]